MDMFPDVQGTERFTSIPTCRAIKADNLFHAHVHVYHARIQRGTGGPDPPGI